jgi:hypothetical protein
MGSLSCPLPCDAAIKSGWQRKQGRRVEPEENSI